MKLIRLLSLLAFSLCLFAGQAKSQVNPSSTYVSGYTKSDGTYVSGYYKTTPNSTNRDNYTTKPNVNPYTGTSGYIQPDTKPLSSGTNYSTPSTYQSPSSYSAPGSSAPISTGSRGGQYYINGNGNKTYIKRN